MQSKAASTGPRGRDSLAGRASENLDFIRRTIEQAERFSAVPALGGAALGLTALGAAWLAHGRDPRMWLAVWLAEAVLAGGLALAATAIRARRHESRLWGRAGRRFFRGLLPPLAAGAVLTAALFRAGRPDLLPGVWLLLYGVAALCASSATIPAVGQLGAAFALLGTVALFAPAAWGDALMAAGFGGLNIVFGILIWRNRS